jgi:hypothetical protein
VTVDASGHERRYPAGTILVLRRGKGDVYSLLALLEDEPIGQGPTPTGRSTAATAKTTAAREASGPPIDVDEHQQRRARQWSREHEPSDVIPF